MGNKDKNRERFFEKVVYRRLAVDREADKMLDRLEVFLKEVVGMRYGLSTAKILFQRHTVKMLQ